jgi:hypothetical protein
MHEPGSGDLIFKTSTAQAVACSMHWFSFSLSVTATKLLEEEAGLGAKSTGGSSELALNSCCAGEGLTADGEKCEKGGEGRGRG